MRYTAPAPAWSERFKRQISVIAMIAVSPALALLRRASLLPHGAMAAVGVCGFAVCLGVCWYWFVLRRPSPSDAPMSERERWIAVTALIALGTLIVFNFYTTSVMHEG